MRLMIPKPLVLFLILFLLLHNLISAQEEKPPEAFADHAENIQGGRVAIQVLSNDFCQEGHQMVIISVTASDYALCEYTDSTVVYIPKILETPPFPPVYPEGDTVYYRVKDINNGLESGQAPVYLDLIKPDAVLPVDSLSVNNYNVKFNSLGNYFYDHYGNHRSNCIIPKNTGKTTLEDSYPFICGQRDNGSTYVAGQFQPNYAFLYPSDFWPGPVIPGSFYNLHTDSVYNKTWKVTREAINQHLWNWQNPGYTPDAGITSWPGNRLEGNSDPEPLAPFTDLNGNHLYEPEAGEVPAVAGDETIFAVYNDHRTMNLATEGNSMGMEIRQLSFAFECKQDSDFYNTFFTRYSVINRSGFQYSDFYFGLNALFKIGNPADDYIGCDTVLNCFYVYNDEIDDYIGYTPAYGASPPAQAICFLNNKLSAFIGPIYVPQVNFDNEIYSDYLKGLWPPGGEPMTFGGNGHGGNDTTTFLYPGDPSDPTQWSNLVSNPATIGFADGMGSVGPFTMSPGDTLKLDVAYVFARDYNGTNLTSVDLLKQRVERIKWFYDNDSTPCGSSWSGVNPQPDSEILLSVYPNPCRDFLYLKSNSVLGNAVMNYSIFNVTGQNVLTGNFSSANHCINIQSLGKGLYFLVLMRGYEIERLKFIRQ